MNWLHYLLEANIYLAVFYAGYCIFLNKETYYTLNRIYLLLSCFISFLLPVFQVGILKPVEPTTQGTVVTIISASVTNAKPVVTTAITNPVTLQDVLLYTYLIGIGVLTIVLLIKLFKLVKMTRAAHKLMDAQYKMVSIEGSNTAFSFFNYLFIGSRTAYSDIIIRHELVHIRQKHSVDILFLEVMKIINWFNPFIYLMQVSLKTVHEYIADEQTAAIENDALTYSSFLVNNAYGLTGSSITHSFFNYNLLKKRIIMLNQKRSGNLARLKYLMAVPICAGMLCASTLGFSKTYGWVDLAPNHSNTAATYKTANIAAEITKRGQADTARVIKQNQITSKGYKYDEDGYLVNGKTDFRVIITEKNGEEKAYFKDSAKPADLALLKNKYGYSFPKMMIHPKLPPPPPVPLASGAKTPKKIKFPLPASQLNAPPPPAPPVPAKLKNSKDVHATLKTVSNKPSKIVDVQLMPPPPPPNPPFDSLYRYIGRHVRYPAVSRENLIAGRVIVTFNINNNKIEDLKITRSLTDIMDGEVVRVLKNYDGPLDAKSGKYAISVSYRLTDEKGNNVGKEPENKALANTKNKSGGNDILVESGPVSMLNEVVVIGYPATRR